MLVSMSALHLDGVHKTLETRDLALHHYHFPIKFDWQTRLLRPRIWPLKEVVADLDSDLVHFGMDFHWHPKTQDHRLDFDIRLVPKNRVSSP